MTSQIGFVVVLMDRFSNCNILHCSNSKAKHVTKSVLAAELFSIVQGFDVASTIRLKLNEMVRRIISLRV